MSDYIVFYMKIACTITQWLHDVLPIKLHVYYMMLHVPAFITWTLHVNLHVWLQIILHVILHPNYMVITYILHDISKKIRSIKPYYMVLHVPEYITWTLHPNLHAWLHIILHVTLHGITWLLHIYYITFLRKIRPIKPGPPPPPRTLAPPPRPCQRACSPQSPGAPARALVPSSPPFGQEWEGGGAQHVLPIKLHV